MYSHKWGKNLGHKKMYYNYSKKMFTGRAEPIRIIGEPDNQRPDKWSSNVLFLCWLIKLAYLSLLII